MTKLIPSIESITHNLAEMIAKKKEVALQEIKPDSQLQDLGLDSMGQLDLIFNAEFFYDIRFPDDYGDPKTVNDVAHLIRKLVSEK